MVSKYCMGNAENVHIKIVFILSSGISFDILLKIRLIKREKILALTHNNILLQAYSFN